MISYTSFQNYLGELGLPSHNLLPDDFESILEGFEYTTEQAGIALGKSDITIRRWCRNGHLKYQRKDPYIILGSDIKQKIFEDRYKTIMEQLKWMRGISEKQILEFLSKNILKNEKDL
jgi:hypothetical protein